uniref:F-box domain-containing protein n=1 Tax=Rhizophora mucronata TaxID=61149 RepID=A0A2P2Q499_RHIMU
MAGGRIKLENGSGVEHSCRRGQSKLNQIVGGCIKLENSSGGEHSHRGKSKLNQMAGGRIKLENGSGVEHSCRRGQSKLNQIVGGCIKLENSSGGECSHQDRISELPDAILVAILSLVSLKEAARVCTLSKRFRNLWLLITDLKL